MSGKRKLFDFQSFLSDFLKHECQSQKTHVHSFQKILNMFQSLSCESTFLGSKCMYLPSVLPFLVKTYRPE